MQPVRTNNFFGKIRIVGILLVMFLFVNVYAKRSKITILYKTSLWENYTSKDTTLLMRYLLSNSKWIYLNQHNNEYFYYSFLGKYDTEMNPTGVCKFAIDTVHTLAARVVISFKNRSDARTKSLEQVVLPSKSKIKVEFKPGNGGYESYLFISDGILNLEIYTLTSRKNTLFIQSLLDYFRAELEMIKQQEKTFNTNGYLKNKWSEKNPDSTYFTIETLGKEGFYLATCHYPFFTEGKVYIKLRDKSTNSNLGLKKTTPQSINRVGFHSSGKVCYQYQHSFLLLDGNYTGTMPVVVEFWFKDSKTGSEVKVGECQKDMQRFNR